MIDIRIAPRLSMKNRSALEQVAECACYHCYKVYPSQEIKDYTDQNSTAICPYCGIDAVLPVNHPDDKNKELLQKIHKYWMG